MRLYDHFQLNKRRQNLVGRLIEAGRTSSGRAKGTTSRISPSTSTNHPSDSCESSSTKSGANTQTAHDTRSSQVGHCHTGSDSLYAAYSGDGRNSSTSTAGGQGTSDWRKYLDTPQVKIPLSNFPTIHYANFKTGFPATLPENAHYAAQTEQPTSSIQDSPCQSEDDSEEGSGCEYDSEASNPADEAWASDASGDDADDDEDDAASNCSQTKANRADSTWEYFRSRKPGKLCCICGSIGAGEKIKPRRPAAFFCYIHNGKWSRRFKTVRPCKDHRTVVDTLIKGEGHASLQALRLNATFWLFHDEEDFAVVQSSDIPLDRLGPI